VGFLVIVLLQIFYFDSNSEISLKIYKYLMKLRRTKNEPHLGHPVCPKDEFEKQ